MNKKLIVITPGSIILFVPTLAEQCALHVKVNKTTV